jgi:hypothetical protein
MPKRRQPSLAGGNVQKSPSSKAAAILTRGAYMKYVSTAKWRERRWRLFSTFPESKPPFSLKSVNISKITLVSGFRFE